MRFWGQVSVVCVVFLLSLCFAASGFASMDVDVVERIVEGDNEILIVKDPPKITKPDNARYVDLSQYPALMVWAKEKGLTVDYIWEYDYQDTQQVTPSGTLPPPDGSFGLTAKKQYGGVTCYTHYNVDFWTLDYPNNPDNAYVKQTQAWHYFTRNSTSYDVKNASMVTAAQGVSYFDPHPSRKYEDYLAASDARWKGDKPLESYTVIWLSGDWEDWDPVWVGGEGGYGYARTVYDIYYNGAIRYSGVKCTASWPTQAS